VSAALYTDFTFASSVVLTALGCVLLGIVRIPSDRDPAAVGKLRTARRIFALSCFLLAVPGYVELCLPADSMTDPALIAPFTLAAAAFQSLLFTALLITFIHPAWSTRRRIGRHLALVTAAAALYLVLRFAFRLEWTTGIALAAYLCQLVCYTLLFRRQYAAALRRLEACYDEDLHYRLRWVRFGFCAALAIGLLASVSAWLTPAAYNLFTVVYTAFYVWFVVRFFNYAADAGFYLKAEAETISEPIPAPEFPAPEAAERAERLRQSLEAWTAAREFTRCDVDTRQIAASLGTDLPFLRYYFRTCMPTDFRSWRLELRVAYARELLAGSPFSINRISREAGFASSSNFYRYFREATGETPADFRRRTSETSSK